MTFSRGPGGRVLRIGHRGAAAIEPENTLRSFGAAVELGVDFVEFDVLDLSDGTLVVAHSDDLAEVSHGAAAGSVRALGLEALREVAPELPTVDEALEFLGPREVGLHVDLKCRAHGAAVARALGRHGLLDRAVVSSFWARTLRDVRREDAGVAVGLTYPEDRYGLARRRRLQPLVPPTVRLLARALPRRLPRWLEVVGAAVAMLHHAVVSPAAVAGCHGRGAAVWSWTVNERALLEQLAAAGVDGVISDDPGIFAG